MLLNKKELIAQGEKELRRDLLDILAYTLKAADPYQLTLAVLKKSDCCSGRRVWVVGAGKGTYRMAVAAERILGHRLVGGWINIPEVIKDGKLKKIKVTLAGHPFPTPTGVLGAQKILETVKRAKADDVILGLFSGGASALMSLPAKGIALDEKIAVTKLLLKTKATINEINSVRKHLSAIKGGRLAQAAAGNPPAGRFLALYLSDVVGDDQSTIASGPTVADKTTFGQAIAVLKKYDVWSRCPKSVQTYLLSGRSGKIGETPKKNFKQVRNIIIGSHRTLTLAAARRGRELDYQIKIITSKMTGDTEKVCSKYLAKVLAARPSKKTLWVAAGETTFKIRTKAPGGRNQQMGLVALSKIQPGMGFVAFDTDGVDGVGPKQVGGVLVDYSTKERVKKLKINIKKARRDNRSYETFERVSGQIKTGYVGTNLGDLVLIARR